MGKYKYTKLMKPKGNPSDGYSVSNDFEKVYLKYSSQGLNNQVEVMMDDWVKNRVDEINESIFRDIKKHSLINSK